MKVQLYEFERHMDERGKLVALEKNELPIRMERVFYMYDTWPDVHRARHAHKSINEMLICLSGSCRVLLDDGEKKQEIVLSRPEEALLVPPELWREIYDFEKGTVVMAIADAPYEESDYIRDYDEFLKFFGKDGAEKAE